MKPSPILMVISPATSNPRKLLVASGPDESHEIAGNDIADSRKTQQRKGKFSCAGFRWHRKLDGPHGKFGPKEIIDPDEAG